METAIPQPAEELRAFFWMAVVEIIYTIEGGQEKTRRVNVLTKTYNPHVNQESLGNIQQQGQIQAFQHKKLPRKAKTVDVIIHGPWMIGHMTDAEFTFTTGEPAPVTVAAEAPANDQ